MAVLVLIHCIMLAYLHYRFIIGSAKLLVYSMTVLLVCYCCSVLAVSTDILVDICCRQHLLVVYDSAGI